MATLSQRRRKSLPKSSFGQPGKRAYPMPDAEHASNAKGRAKQQLKKGNLSKSQYDTIVAKANRKLGTTKKKATSSASRRRKAR